MAKGLVIYGEIMTGKSTLELNLRNYYLGYVLTRSNLVSNGHVGFLGPTAKKDGTLRSCGGADVLKCIPELNGSEWYVAAILSKGFDLGGVKNTWAFLESLDELHAICMFTNNREPYHLKRTLRSCGRAPRRSLLPARPWHPAQVHPCRCYDFATETMNAAFMKAVSLIGNELGSLSDPGEYKLKLLEDFDE